MNSDVFDEATQEQHSRAVDRYLRSRVEEVNRKDIAAWEAVRTLQEWEEFKRPRMKALTSSLGSFTEPDKTVAVTTTGTIDAKDYRIDRLVFESRPGIVVTANVFKPIVASIGVGVLLVHSHHNPRTQPELQDVGAMWARVGCTVLVMDQFAYGERRDHPAGPRHDYWNRYNTGVQLQLIGDSLMGWMVWDLRRGIDVLEQHYQANQVVMMGSVAGGGDPCAVAAALDDRVSVAIPFNFGGPQPETPYPLPDDAVKSFNYLGSGGWETTRNLLGSGRDGFLPWVIVGSIAPRKLIYAHEFSWDQERDPVWKRLQRIYKWHGAKENLDYAQGFGLLKGRPPHASHCNNVGPVHRERIHAALNRWLGVPIPDDQEDRRDEGELLCRGEESTPYFEVIARIGHERAEGLRNSLEGQTAQEKQVRFREAWRERLGNVDPDPGANVVNNEAETFEGTTVERFGLALSDGITLPVVLMRRTDSRSTTILLAQKGKAAVVAERGEMIDALLESQVVCLVDVRGTGEIGGDESRGGRSRASGRAATALMVGESILGMQLRDLRSVIGYLRQSGLEDIQVEDVPLDTSMTASSFAESTEDKRDDRESQIVAESFEEPMGGMLAYLVTVFEEDVTGGSMPDASGQLAKRMVNWPMDAVAPGAAVLGSC
jgi:hypothetical protein